MQLYSLGLVTVASAGTPVSLPSTGIAMAPGGMVHAIEYRQSPASAGVVYPVVGGVKAMSMPKIVSDATVPCFKSKGGEGNRLQFSAYALDAATNGDGAYIDVWVA